MILLHQFPQSHFCIRIRWALAYKQIPYEVKNYSQSRMDEVAQIANGYRQVPVLQWNDQIICDSSVIARFLEQQKSTLSLYPNQVTPAQCDMVNAWIDTKVMLTAAKWMVKDYLNYLKTDADRELYRARFKKIHGITTEQATEMHDQLTKDIEVHWKLLEEALTDNKFILADQLSYADLGVASRLRLMKMVTGYEIPAAFPKMQAWYRGIGRLAD